MATIPADAGVPFDAEPYRRVCSLVIAAAEGDEMLERMVLAQDDIPAADLLVCAMVFLSAVMERERRTDGLGGQLAPAWVARTIADGLRRLGYDPAAEARRVIARSVEENW
jgi:hypothetical protein